MVAAPLKNKQEGRGAPEKLLIRRAMSASIPAQALRGEHTLLMRKDKAPLPIKHRWLPLSPLKKLGGTARSKRKDKKFQRLATFEVS